MITNLINTDVFSIVLLVIGIIAIIYLSSVFI